MAAVADTKKAEKNAHALGVAKAVGGGTAPSGNGGALNTAASAAALNTPLASATSSAEQTIGMDELTSMLMSSVVVPDRRSSTDPFYMAVDHAFLVKGHGTVMTGTILKGKVSVNDTVEVPSLRISKKVKSMQMFREPVKVARKGDRVGICVAGMDSTGKAKIERGVLSAPGTVLPIYAALAKVSKVRFFKRKCKSLSRVHITVGHATVMATVLFFGARELAEGAEASLPGTASAAAALAGDSTAKKAREREVPFDWSKEFVYQDFMLGRKGGATNGQWAFLQFETPVFCAADSTLIGSRLDLEEPGACRIAFHGKVNTALGQTDVIKAVAAGKGAATGEAAASVGEGGAMLPKGRGNSASVGGRCTGLTHPLRENLRIYKTKERVGRVVRVAGGSSGGGGPVEIIGDKLFEKGSDMSKFIGMNLVIRGKDGDKAWGKLDGPFGSSGKFKATFPSGTCVQARDVIALPFKVFVFDAKKRMVTLEGKAFGGR